MKFRIAAALALLVAAACKDEPTGPRIPAILEVVSGGGQAGPAGVELSQPITVLVTDDKGRPVRNQLVNFRVTQGGGTFFAGAGMTNADGLVSDRWTLGTTAGVAQAAEARAVDPETGAAIVFASFTATAQVGPAASVAKVGGDAQTAPAGEALADSLSVRVTDQFGNVVSGVTVTWSVTGGGGAVSPTTSTTSSAGIARTGWTLGPDRGPATATATAAGLAATFNATTASAGFRVASVTIGSGSMYTCALTLAGAAYCWGNMIADPGATASPSGCQYFSNPCSSVPLAVAGGLQFTTLVAGWAHTCGIASGGGTYCWWANSQGQLGDSTTVPRTAPTPVKGGHSFTALATGSEHTCALASGGLAYCWGANYGRSQPAPGATSPWVPSPVDTARAAAQRRFTRIASAGRTNCGIATSGTTLCWGLGVGFGFPDQMSPVPVYGDPAFVSVFAGRSHFCGLDASGAASCWGVNDRAQLGDGTHSSRSAPTPVAGTLRFTTLALGYEHSCGLTQDGTAYCWGSNEGGQLGDGTVTPRPLPVPVSTSLKFTQLAAGTSHTCAIAITGVLWCWGYNGIGEVGDGTQTPRLTPVRVVDPT